MEWTNTAPHTPTAAPPTTSEGKCLVDATRSTAAGWGGAKLANSKKMAHPPTALCRGMATGTIVLLRGGLFGVGKAVKREISNYWS